MEISRPADAIAIDSGGGASGRFLADIYANGGRIATSAAPVDTRSVTDPAPQAVYQAERYGNFTYTISNLTAGGTYLVRLHFAEIYWGAPGKRLFNVAINGAAVLDRYDVFARAGGKNKAVVEEFTASADASGRITIRYTTLVDNAKRSGIEIIPVKVFSTGA